MCRRAVPVLILYYWLFCLPTIIGTLFHSLDVLTRIFEIERASRIRHDIIFCGDFLNLHVNPAFAESFQLAVRSEKWILTVEDGQVDSISDEDGNSIIFFVVPSTLEIFYAVLDAISKFDSTNNMTKIKAKRSFVISWPHEEDPGRMDVARSLENNPVFIHIAKQIQLNEEVYILVWTTQDNSSGAKSTNYQLLDIIEVYGVNGEVAVIRYLGVWNGGGSKMDAFSTNQMNTAELAGISRRRRNFHGVEFKAVAQVSEDERPDEYYEAEVDVKEFPNGTVYFAGGTSLLAFQDFIYLLNFTYEPIKGVGWTSLAPDGKGLEGLGRQIVSHEADISVSTSSMLDYRSHFISFFQPIGTERSYVFFRQPSIAAARNIFTMPFQVRLWLSILGALTLIILSGYGVAFLMRYTSGDFSSPGATGKLFLKTWMPNQRKEASEETFHYYDVHICILGSLCQQGWYHSPGEVPLRILFITSFVAHLVIYAYYTAAFVAAISAPVTPIKQFDDLQRHQYKVIVDPDNLELVYSFATSPTQGQNIIQSSKSLFTDDEVTVRDVLQSSTKYAAIMPQDDFYKTGTSNYSTQELCTIEKLAGKRESRINDAMMVRRGAPYREIFEKHWYKVWHSCDRTVTLIERGLAHRYWTSYETARIIRCIQNTNINFGLNMLDCYTAFVVFLVGCLLSLIWAFLERHHHQLLLQKPQQPSNWFSSASYD